MERRALLGANRPFGKTAGDGPSIMPTMPDKGEKVVLAMSGGVDSSVAAALLQRQGYDVIGAFMRLGTPQGVQTGEVCDISAGKQGCCSARDAGDARRVAGLLGIPFYVLNFQDDFGRVIDYFVNEYNAGRTPNPCIRCNEWLKFGKLAQYAQAVGAKFIASGHYARTVLDETLGRRVLMRGRDLRKDQSYVLFGMSPEALQHTLFPVGDLEKSQVRAIAQEIGLPVFDKPDSQEICFVPDQDYAALLRRRTPEAFTAGEFVDAQGRTLGVHSGHQQFTIGQRKGLGIALGERTYVLDINAATNRVTLGSREDLLHTTVLASHINILHPMAEGAAELPCLAKIRYNFQPCPARLTLLDEGCMKVVFDEPQSAITPGQAVVVYRDDTVLAGAWIDRAE